MMFRDDLYQANRRIQNLEGELQAARSDRDHLAAEPATITVTEPRPPRRKRVTAAAGSPLEFYEWWPVLAVPVLAIVFLIISGTVESDLDTWADFPLTWVFASAIVGSAIYSVDVLLRRFQGKRGVLGRLMIVAAYIAGGPALLMCFLLFGGIMGYVAPILAVVFGVGYVIHWIVRGS